jgi:hypothetical protein
VEEVLKSRDSVAYIHILYAIYILEGGGLYRLQPPRDGGSAADARAEGHGSTIGRQERRALEKVGRRWRRVHARARLCAA